MLILRILKYMGSGTQDEKTIEIGTGMQVERQI
jgi:hypothetical protein